MFYSIIVVRIAYTAAAFTSFQSTLFPLNSSYVPPFPFSFMISSLLSHMCICLYKHRLLINSPCSFSFLSYFPSTPALGLSDLMTAPDTTGSAGAVFSLDIKAPVYLILTHQITHTFPSFPKSLSSVLDSCAHLLTRLIGLVTILRALPASQSTTEHLLHIRHGALNA